ncbi:PASTA domain-containing protein [Streptomyces sp. 8N706]|uniref:PASTA domain-containing protein n=1 Tax=Streptomyces sp. 8N706 TaxID=3457416 RepID=UPI003FCF146A
MESGASAAPVGSADRRPLPDLVGRSVTAAQDAARSAGFLTPRTYDALGLGRSLLSGDDWKVCAQEPRPGEVETTAEITLGAVLLDETCPGGSPDGPPAWR